MIRSTSETSFEPENEAQRRALAFLQFEGSSEDAAPFPGIGDRVAGFVIEAELGRGGAGIVYRAQQLGLARSVALKLIPHGPFLLTEAYARRLEREARMLASVKHEAIPTVHAAGVVPGFHYVAVDLVEGTTLKELIHGRARGFPGVGEPGWLPFVLGLLHRIAGALGAAHARGIVHRDVKPANVLVDREGRPSLVDFGLAREHGSTGHTLTRGFVGTPEYASPEQLRGEPLDVTSDVFSFGVLAFEAMSGARPFRARTPRELEHEILVADPSWPAARRIPRELRAVIEKCLEKKAAERYEGARAVEAELARVLRFEPVRAIPRGPATRVWHRVRRRPWTALVGAGAIAFLVVTGIAVALFRERSAAREAERYGERLARVVRLFGRGAIDDYRRELQALLEEGAAPAEVAGRRADVHLLDGEPALAFPLYARALAEGSEDFADWAGCRGTRAVVEGRIPEALFATARSPKTSRDSLVLALYQELRGDTAAALDAIRQGLEANALPVAFRLLEIKYLARLGDTSEIARELALACQLRKWDRQLPCLLARTLVRLRRFEDAEDFLLRALERAPEDPLLLAELSLCKGRLFEPDEAFDLAQRAYACAPSEGRVLDALAAGLIGLRRPEEANALLSSAQVLRPDDPFVYERSARLALSTGAPGEAEWFAQQLFSASASDEAWYVPSLELAAEIEVARGNVSSALALFRELEAREPEIVDWPLWIGRLLTKLGDLAAARAAFERALVVAPLEPEVLYEEARNLRADRRGEEAAAVLEKALWRASEEGTTHYWLGLTRLELGQAQVALHSALEAVRAHDDWMEAWLLRARCEAAIGAHEDAVASYRAALERRDEPVVRAELAALQSELGREPGSFQR